MSLQTTLARSQVRTREMLWKNHKDACPKCSRRRERCREGEQAWGQLTDARAALIREREADKAPSPGQLTFDDLGG